MTLKLMPHQVEGVDWVRRTPKGLLGDDPGLGKSAQALAAAREPVLIVTPAMLRGTWMDPDFGEVAKWAPGMDVTWVSYSSLCWRDGRKTLPVPKKEFTDRQWGSVIFDEAHYLKGRKTKWTKAAWEVSLRTRRCLLMTGTPIPNWAHELYMPIRFIHSPLDRRFTSYWRWIDEWFTTFTPPYLTGGAREIGGLRKDLSWEDFARGNDLGQLMLRRLRDDVLKDLPPLTETTLTVPMGAAQRKVYRGLKDDYCAWVEETGDQILAFSDGSLYQKLAQVTTGIPTLVPGTPADPGLSCKLDALKELLEERPAAPVVVFAHYRASADAAAKVAAGMGRTTGLIMGGMSQDERDRQVKAFQAGEIDVLVGTLGTLAEGVTLTRSSTCVMLERGWRPSVNEQAMRRLHRIGQTAPVTVIHVVTEDSLDQRILALLRAKSDQQMATLRAADLVKML